MDAARKQGQSGAVYDIVSRVRLVEERNYRVTQITMQGDQRSPWHVHTEIEDLFYITAGVLRITQHNPPETREIHAGESFSIQAKRPHFIEVADKRTVSFLLIQGYGQCDFNVVEDPNQPMTNGDT
ncbi:cupin domain-containing protein [Bordetella sp. N]|uniref:cupin domain-containing protein n=1 Tax=Bordetella sp. N TaxID=1746199 RepID=UPI00070FF5EA|nr:cupin domain-containing protein [Bordetella sp. N]ALM86059.1 hypothetical protein ASB57_26670 [Bordetella sp. N]